MNFQNKSTLSILTRRNKFRARYYGETAGYQRKMKILKPSRRKLNFIKKENFETGNKLFLRNHKCWKTMGRYF